MKFLDPSRVDIATEAGTRDFLVFRLAEAYLIAAEGLYMSGRTNEALDYINVVRRRAAHPGKSSEMEAQASDLSLDFILDERARELLGEHVRWFDLVRTGKLIERVKLHNSQAANGIQDFINDYIFDGIFLLFGEDGSVINNDKTPILHWAEGKIWVNNHAHVLAEKEGSSLRFIYYCLSKTDVSQIVRGTPPKINQESLKSIKIPLPPLEVQEEIVRILDKFTELTAELTARKKQYEYYMEDILSFSNYMNIEYATLEQIATIKARIGWQGLTTKEYLDTGDYYLITGVDFKNGLVDFENCHFVKKERFDQDKNIQIKNDDVLVTKDGTLGKVAYVKNLEKPATLNSGVFVIRSKTPIILNRFLFYYLKSSKLMNFAQSNL